MSVSRIDNSQRGDDSELEELSTALASSVDVKDRLTAPRKQALWAQIADGIAPKDPHPYYSAREGDWRALKEDVALKVFERDPESGMATYLVRYQPGSSFPKHAQHSREECLLVSGDLQIGDRVMRPGDLQIAVPGPEHGPLISQRGALVFVRGHLSPDPQELPPASIDPA